MCKFIQLKKIYVNLAHRSILTNITLSLNSNQVLTLIGPNGAGKSTLIRVILGLIQPNSGVVFRKRNLSIGYIPQKPYLNPLLPITVKRFMQLSQKNHNTNIFQILKRVKAHMLQNRKLQELSGGEIQKILLARAILNNPNLLILDEPMQGLDVIGQLTFYQLINEIRNEFKCSILIVSHDLNFVAAKTDNVICLNNHICCSGTPENVRNHSEFISIFGSKRINELAFYQHDHNHIHDF